MKKLNIIYLLVGVALFGFILSRVDLQDLVSQVYQIGWGILVICALYFLAFFVDTISWQLTFTSVPMTPSWSYKLWKVRMVGEALNNATPLAALGGEPIKSLLLKKHYAIGYKESVATLILARTTNLLALIVFLSAGFIAMLNTRILPQSYNMVAGTGLAVFVVAIALFFLVQRYKISSLTGSTLARTKIGRSIEDILHHIHDLEDRLIHFYTAHHRRFALAASLALLNWLIGILELYATLYFLGSPITLTQALIVESMAQLVRAGTFFIPASLGAQEGIFLLLIGAITGNPVLGLATALIRRFRELIWVAWGLTLGWFYSFLPDKEEISKTEPPLPLS